MEATLSLSFSCTIRNLPMCANSFYGPWFQWGMGHGKCIPTEFYGQSRNRIQSQMSQTALFLFIVLTPQNWQLLIYHHCPSDRVSCAYPSVLSLPRATWRRHNADTADLQCVPHLKQLATVNCFLNYTAVGEGVIHKGRKSRSLSLNFSCRNSYLKWDLRDDYSPIGQSQALSSTSPALTSEGFTLTYCWAF